MHCSSFSGPIKEQISSGTVSEKKPFEQSVPVTVHAQRDNSAAQNDHTDYVVSNVCMDVILEIDD